jgi:predicted metal-dependent hydrolase
MSEMRRIEYGAQVIEFQVVRRDRRTLEIAVEPDASVVVTAPHSADFGKIDAKVRKRAAWVLRQQRYFQAFLPHTPERRFITGETHLYLGRQYRLRVLHNGTNSVKLIRGFIVIDLPQGSSDGDVRAMVEQWYRDRAHLRFTERLAANLLRFSSPERYKPRGIIVRRLERRWGSMSPAGRLLLNLRLIESPIHCIDYVITHELCHRTEAHHGPAFFELLSRVMPDWPKRKEVLERLLS